MLMHQGRAKSSMQGAEAGCLFLFSNSLCSIPVTAQELPVICNVRQKNGRLAPIPVGMWNRHHVANCHSNLETVHILVILRGFLGKIPSHSQAEPQFTL